MKAAILAKKSERFPGKHMKLIGRETMIGRIARTLSSTGIFDEVIVFTKDPSVHTDLAKVVGDHTEGTALDSIIHLVEEYGEVFVIAGDMPLISGEFVKMLMSDYHGIPVFPARKDGELEPLSGIYNSSMLDVLRSSSESGRKSLRSAIKMCRHETINAVKYERDLLNVNLEGDLEKIFQN